MQFLNASGDRGVRLVVMEPFEFGEFTSIGDELGSASAARDVGGQTSRLHLRVSGGRNCLCGELGAVALCMSEERDDGVSKDTTRSLNVPSQHVLILHVVMTRTPRRKR